MTKYIFLLAIVLICSAFYSSASAQSDTLYLEADRLFMNLALQKSRALKQEYLGNFGRNAEIYLEENFEEDSEDRHKRAAKLIIALFGSEKEAMGLFYEKQDAPASRKSLEADELIIEYMRALIKKPSIFKKDSVKQYANEIETEKGRTTLKEDLDERLGKGISREEKAARIIRQMYIDYGNVNLDRLPYPLCLITKNCPR